MPEANAPFVVMTAMGEAVLASNLVRTLRERRREAPATPRRDRAAAVVPRASRSGPPGLAPMLERA